MDRTAMITYWGAENLKRWPEKTVHGVAIPAASMAFLTEVGLPAPGRMIWVWTLTWNDALPYLPGSSHLRILGNNHSRPILVDERRGGCVIWGGSDKVMERYANASVEQFAESLVEMDKIVQHDDRVAGDTSFDARAQRRAVKDFRNRLGAIDATAVADHESLWSNIIVEMRVEIQSSTI